MGLRGPWKTTTKGVRGFERRVGTGLGGDFISLAGSPFIENFVLELSLVLRLYSSLLSEGVPNEGEAENPSTEQCHPAEQQASPTN